MMFASFDPVGRPGVTFGCAGVAPVGSPPPCGGVLDMFGCAVGEDCDTWFKAGADPP